MLLDARLPAVLAALLLAGCTDSVVELGIIDFGGGGARIDSPREVSVGESFTVRVTTFGNDCISYDSTKVVIEGSNTIIEPYDSRVTGGACTMLLNYYPHDASLQFDEVGSPSIFVRGRRHFGATDDAVIEVPISVSVH